MGMPESNQLTARAREPSMRPACRSCITMLIMVGGQCSDICQGTDRPRGRNRQPGKLNEWRDSSFLSTHLEIAVVEEARIAVDGGAVAVHAGLTKGVEQQQQQQQQYRNSDGNGQSPR